MLATPERPAPAEQRAIALQHVGGLRGDYARWALRCYRIRNKQRNLRPFVLNAGQRRVSEIEAEEHAKKGECRGMILKARQGGFSTDQQARALHQIWSQPNFDALTLAHTKEDTEKLFAITTRAIEHLRPRSCRTWATRRRARSPASSPRAAATGRWAPVPQLPLARSGRQRASEWRRATRASHLRNAARTAGCVRVPAERGARPQPDGATLRDPKHG